MDGFKQERDMMRFVVGNSSFVMQDGKLGRKWRKLGILLGELVDLRL